MVVFHVSTFILQLHLAGSHDLSKDRQQAFTSGIQKFDQDIEGKIGEDQDPGRKCALCQGVDDTLQAQRRQNSVRSASERLLKSHS